MSVAPVIQVPITYFRSHTKECLHRINHMGEHIMLTGHGKWKATIIPVHHTRPLWQLQRRPIKDVEARIKSTYAALLEAKATEDGLRGVRLHEWFYSDWAGLQRM